MTEDRSFRGHMAMLMANVIFGINIPISKTALVVVDSYALTLYRIIFCAVVMWFMSLFTAKERVAPKDLLLIFLASFFGIQINQMFFFGGLAFTTPINASIIATLVPIETMIIAALYLKEPITFKKAAGVVVGCTGALMLVMAGTSALAGGSMKGDLMCLLSTFAYAIYLTVFRDVIRRYTPLTLMKWMFLFGGIVLVPILHKHLSISDIIAYPKHVIWELAYVLVFASLIAYLLIPIGQKNLRPTVVSTYNYIQPVMASLLAVILGMDSFGWYKFAAAALVFLGVYITTTSKSRADMERAKVKS